MICCATFEEVFENIKQDPTIIGMMAIENTIAGSLLHNYELLRDSGTSVVGEHKLHISHCVCCMPDDDWNTVTEIHSHPVALMQCRGFLSRHPEMKAVENEDTAGSAKEIFENRRHGHAAICSAAAAEMYGMKILENHIEDNTVSRCLRPEESRLPPPDRENRQVEPRLLTAPRGRVALTGTEHTFVL